MGLRPAFLKRGDVNLAEKNIPEYIILHHTSIASSQYDQQLNVVNVYHKSRWGNCSGETGYCVAYHIFVGRDGTVIQTRAFSEPGPHTDCTKLEQCKDDRNFLYTRSIGIVMAGDFTQENPSKRQWEAFKEQVLLVQREFGIDDEHVLLNADTSKTACPGQDFHPRNWKNIQTTF